jgi:hypothetical protein
MMSSITGFEWLWQAFGFVHDFIIKEHAERKW